MPSKPPAPSDLADKFMLRLPDGMRDRIAQSAKANNRSMNAEIIARLELTFGGMPSSPDEIAKAIERIERRIGELSERL